MKNLQGYVSEAVVIKTAYELWAARHLTFSRDHWRWSGRSYDSGAIAQPFDRVLRAAGIGPQELFERIEKENTLLREIDGSWQRAMEAKSCVQ